MGADALALDSGRVLVLGGSAVGELVRQLQARGFECATVDGPDAVQAPDLEPRGNDVLLLDPDDASAKATLDRLRALTEGLDLPVVNLSARDPAAQGLDEVAIERLVAAVSAQRAASEELRRRKRLEALLEITQATGRGMEADETLAFAVQRLGAALGAERCSVILVEGAGPQIARVVATREGEPPDRLDMARYPELRRALATRLPVVVDDARHDPLMAEVRKTLAGLDVRSILVQPLIWNDDVLGALFLRVTRRSAHLSRDDQELVQAVAATLANALRAARSHHELKRKREDLESAYVDRYRELQEANRRLRETNRTKDELLAICSHDLRAPLQVLLGHGRFLLDDEEIRDDRKLSVEAMVRQGRKILGLVESLLSQGKRDASLHALQPLQLDLSELCIESARDLSIIGDERGVRVRGEAPESLLVMGDEVKLREVIQNLVTNAIEHAASEVVLGARRLSRPDGDRVRVSVRDDGPGIEVSELSSVFDRYRHGASGIGLGLAICKEFIELHGGDIWAEPVPSGGVEFVFTLQLADPAHEKARKSSLKPDQDRPRVLVVEDEPEVLEFITGTLRSEYRVETARDGAEGMAKAQELSPDLVVMDVFLPRVDGLDAMVALGRAPQTRDIPIILISARQEVEDKLRSLDLGAVDYMHRPFQALELLARVERALKLRKTEEDLALSRLWLRRSGSDPQTGLLGESGLRHRLEQELMRARRYGRGLVACCLSPTDEPPADLRGCGSWLRGAIRIPDVVGHVGEGTFIVLITECTAEEATNVTGRLAHELREVAGVKYRSEISEPDAQEDAVSFLERLTGDGR